MLCNNISSNSLIVEYSIVNYTNVVKDLIMIYTYNFPFGVSEMTIKTLNPLKKDIEEDISSIINNFQFELNHNLIGSSAKRFNNSEPNFPIFVKSEFLAFLLENIEICNLTRRLFNPFSNIKSFETLTDTFIVDYSTQTVTKTRNSRFDTSLLRKNYIINSIAKFLNEEKRTFFLISTDSAHFASGDIEWEIDFDKATLDHSIKAIIKDESVILESFKENIDFKFKKSFAGVYQAITPDYFTLEGYNLCYLTAIKDEFTKIKYKEQINDISNKWGVGVTLFARGEEVTHASPVTKAKF